LTDIFGVESEIAKGIAESLQAKLTSREEQALAVKPTKNPEAYDAYLRGLASNGRTIWIVDAHRDDGRRFIVHADEKLSAFVELERQVLTVTFYLESIRRN
jgi:hypothetical protein